MKSTRAAIMALMVFLGGVAKAKDNPPLKLAETISLPGLKDGDFDHFALDLEGHRLFLTGEENDKVLVFDTSTNKLIHTIEESKAPHAILYRGDLKKLFVVEGDASAVKVYDGETYKPIAEIKVSVDADSIAYDAATHYLYVVNGGREAHTPYSLISVIDTNTSKKLRDIKIESNHVEASDRLVEPVSHKSVVNVYVSHLAVSTMPLPLNYVEYVLILYSLSRLLVAIHHRMECIACCIT